MISRSIRYLRNEKKPGASLISQSLWIVTVSFSSFVLFLKTCSRFLLVPKLTNSAGVVTTCRDCELVCVSISEIDGLEEEPSSPAGEDSFATDSNLRQV